MHAIIHFIPSPFIGVLSKQSQKDEKEKSRFGGRHRGQGKDRSLPFGGEWVSGVGELVHSHIQVQLSTINQALLRCRLSEELRA